MALVEEGDAADSGALQRLMPRFFPAYCLLVAAITFGYALYDPFQIDGDAVAYMDIGELIRGHIWAGVVNGYWHPLYPACLTLGRVLFHSTRENELHAYYLVNFAIFLLQMVAIVCFTDAIAALRTTGDFLLGKTELRYLGLGLLVVASQRELSLGKVRPDALLQALLLFAMSSLLTHLRTGLVRYTGLMGFALGLAYLTKSFAFLFGLICIAVLIAFRWWWQETPAARALLSGTVALVCFAVVAGPYVTALSRQKGRFNFGESGALNYAWYVGGTEKMHLEPWQTEKFGAAEVKLKHPEKQLMESPGIYSYAQLPYGTYPDWFDTTFFNDQIKPKTAIKGEIRRGSRNVVLVFRYVLNHPEPVVLLALFVALGAGLSFNWRSGADAFWVVPLGLGVVIWAIYGTVNVEERYVTVGYLAIVLTLFAMLRNGRIRALAGAMILIFAVMEPMESLRKLAEMRRQESVKHLSAGWVHPETVEAVKGLNQLGVKPGDSVACIGWRGCLYDQYWARVAGVRILTEIYAPDGPADGYLEAMPNRAEAIETVRRQGDKVLVGYFNEARMTGRTAATEGWQQLGESHLYALPLNLPSGAQTKPAKVGHAPSMSDED
ncbi:glycosyltransferase family 39 protein [Granulicella sibirica]|uniref:Uncharacterized protein n=1 Tax=Granulicella sibirica TaxID=2479048 RepID=A0A4Q0TAE6_9BACT|nr:glycosyltransferase family 39 protein [Granulicella sibirica]RXH58746.1 hypothetical protein GRAN_2056 [Granulicella sibirica]